MTGSNRVLRGGSWNNDTDNLRSANRDNNDPANRNANNGFRPVSTALLPLRGVHGLRGMKRAVPTSGPARPGPPGRRTTWRLLRSFGAGEGFLPRG
jgi:hypothetical protein